MYSNFRTNSFVGTLIWQQWTYPLTKAITSHQEYTLGFRWLIRAPFQPMSKQTGMTVNSDWHGRVFCISRNVTVNWMDKLSVPSPQNLDKYSVRQESNPMGLFPEKDHSKVSCFTCVLCLPGQTDNWDIFLNSFFFDVLFSWLKLQIIKVILKHLF